MLPLPIRRLAIALAILPIMAATAVQAPCEVVRRAAFDIGSGTTKLKVADVDLETNQIVAIIVDSQLKVDYADDLTRSADGNLSEKIIAQGVKALSKLNNEARDHGATAFFGVAPAVFERAGNTKHILDALTKATGMPINILDQKEEAAIGFYGARQKLGASEGGLAVWDIGGDTMQLIVSGPEDKLLFYLGSLASVDFKNSIIKHIQKKTLDSTYSPNPLGTANAEKAVQYAMDYATANVPDPIKRELSRNKGAIVGIGGVFWHSLRGQTKKEKYDQRDLEQALARGANMTDSQLGGKYAETEITNVALVLGFMRGLGIDSILALDANQADGVLTTPKFWQRSTQK